jgi:hypothetical protein
MPSRQPHSGRTGFRRAAHSAALWLCGFALVLVIPTPAQAATEARGDTKVDVALADYATPGTRTPAGINIDPFGSFLGCLAEAAHSDSMYPGIDPAEVNGCLEKYGF